MLYIYDKHHIPSDALRLEDADLHFFSKLSKVLPVLVKDPIVKSVVKSIDDCTLEDNGNVVTSTGSIISLGDLSSGSKTVP